MKSTRFILLTGLIFLYTSLFSVQAKRGVEREVFLQAAMPVEFYQIAAGYLKELVAEMLFVRSIVFIGGVKTGTSEKTYVDSLGNNFEVMTQLYPRFLDPYYISQAFLPHVSLDAATQTNRILETGIKAYPEDVVLRFFHGTNFFLFMNEPLKGAKAFEVAAKLPEAPPMFAHLAAILSAEGGNIAAGLISLKAMVAIEKEESVKMRYMEEIEIFEQVLTVQKAILEYSNIYGVAPDSLEQLIPRFVIHLPEINDSFVLVYNPPLLKLLRPDRQ